MLKISIQYIIGITVFVMVSISLPACKSKSKTVSTYQKSIRFINNDRQLLSDIIEQAEKTEKLIFVDFHADWCLPCKILDEEVFNQREVFQFFNKNFINYKVDVEKNNGANLKLMYGADELPTLLFLDSKGRMVTRNMGSVTQTSLMNMAKKAINK